MKYRSRKRLLLLFIFIVFLLTLIITPFIGSQPLNYHHVVSYLQGTDSPDGRIFFDIRLPRILLAALTGAALSLAGVVFQALLRNPLATPYTLGVSSGGALGAVVVIKTGLVLSFLGFTTIQIGAFAGSLLTIALVFLLARQAGRLAIHTMILAGVTVSYFFAALILMLHFWADFTETKQMVRWMMGGLDVVNNAALYYTLPVVLAAAMLILLQGRMFNLISMSEEVALSKGVSVSRVQKIAFLSASLMTGAVVAVSGPIGFVGLIVPHFLRLLIGVDHRYLIPASLFFGGAFLALCDTAARTLLAPVDIPVGIITAIIGGPFFLYLLMRHK
ncbi:MAG: iron ABC transporter permease [Calditrichia bacterium]